jgi:hypothetical protein
MKHLITASCDMGPIEASIVYSSMFAAIPYVVLLMI